MCTGVVEERVARRIRLAFEIVALIEAVLFASPEPVSPDELRVALAEVPGSELEPGLEALERRLESPDRGLRLQKIAGGYRLVTRDDLAEPLRRLFRFRNRKRLTPASLDVLSIIAYAQPMTAPEIHEIRGTDPAYALRVLQERRMIRVVGRKRVVGRPMLFGIRPEHLTEQRAHTSDADCDFSADISVLEPLGVDTMVFIQIGGEEITGRATPQSVTSVGSRMGFTAHMDHMHLIDPSTDLVV